jgi:putative hydrolase of the HAD superfamily
MVRPVSTIRGVLFDYGGVLTTPPRRSIEEWVLREGIDPGSFSRVLKAWLSRNAPTGNPLHRLETGHLSAAEFNAELTRELLMADGTPVPEADHLAGIFSTILPEPAMVGFIRRLRDRDVPLALISNSWGNDYPAEVLDLFDEVVISGEVGLRKPQPEIYHLTLERLGLLPAEAALVDDGSPNIDAAGRLGLTGVLHTSTAPTIDTLESILTTTLGTTFHHTKEHSG